jgi:phytanoyl-CoA hydroxylase
MTMPLTEHLTEQQCASYWSQGYLLLPGLIGPELLSRFNQRFVDLVNGKVPLCEGMKIMQDVMVVKGAVAPESPVHAVNKLLCLEEDPDLFEFARRPELVGAVQSLLGKELYSLSSNVFNKPPGVDGRHPLHQDLRYFKLRPADQIIGVWTALLPAPREAGCIAVIPGSHKQDLLPHESPDWDYVNHGFFGLNDVDVEARVHVEMAPGDTLLFHPLLIHGSGRNRSKDFRRAISVHYASGSCESAGKDWRLNPFTRRIA